MAASKSRDWLWLGVYASLLCAWVIVGATNAPAWANYAALVGWVVFVGINIVVLLTVWWRGGRAKRPRMRFSLKALLVVMTMVCLAAGWIGSQVHSARRQRQAAETVRTLGGTVNYDLTYQELDALPLRRWMMRHEWFRGKLDDHYFQSLTRIQFGAFQSERLFNNDDLPVLAAFPKLEYATMYETDVTTDGLKFFQRFKRLKRIHLGLRQGWVGGDGEGLNDLADIPTLTMLSFFRVRRPRDGYAFLRRMPQLVELAMDEMELGEGDLSHIATLTRLKQLDLSGMQWPNGEIAFLDSLRELKILGLSECGLKDDDLRTVGRLDKLKFLSLGDNPITSAGVAHLSELTEMLSVSLSGTQIDAAGLDHLAGMTRLQTLNLARTPLGDESVPVLGRWKGLGSLDVRGTKLTKEGQQALERALPNCTIRGDGLPDPTIQYRF